MARTIGEGLNSHSFVGWFGCALESLKRESFGSLGRRTEIRHWCP